MAFPYRYLYSRKQSPLLTLSWQKELYYLVAGEVERPAKRPRIYKKVSLSKVSMNDFETLLQNTGGLDSLALELASCVTELHDMWQCVMFTACSSDTAGLSVERYKGNITGLDVLPTPVFTWGPLTEDQYAELCRVHIENLIAGSYDTATFAVYNISSMKSFFTGYGKSTCLPLSPRL